MFKYLPENISTFGGEIDSLIFLIYGIVGFFFVVMESYLLVAVLRFRRTKGRAATFLTGESRAAVTGILVFAAVVFTIDLGIDVKGARAWAMVKENIPRPDLVVRVRAQQFYWDFIYAGPDEKLDTKDDVTIRGSLRVPVGKTIKLELESTDVIHSFFVPAARFKQDVLPGRKIGAWFSLTKTGTYPIACAELCGLGHTRMFGELIVQTPEEFEAWKKEAVGEEIVW
mgnify:CR=1 FL=1